MGNLKLSRHETRFGYRILALGLVLLACGLFGTWLGLRTIGASEAAERWPVTRGVVLSSGILSHPSRSRSGTDTTYELAVTYEYTVDRIRYESDRIVYTGGFKSPFKGEIQKLKAGYEPGGSVAVYYKPDDPGVSLLIPGSSGDSGLALSAVLVGTAVVGISMAIVVQRLVAILHGSRPH